VGIGPAAVLFYEQKKWSASVVLQNIWSPGGTGTDEVNDFSAQYLDNYNFSGGWYLFSNSSITADWLNESVDRWTAPVGLGVGKVIAIGKQSAIITFQGVSNVVRPDNTPGWALNFQFALLFP